MPLNVADSILWGSRGDAGLIAGAMLQHQDGSWGPAED
jgi:hypothetical protein